jgi:MraZ protein
MSKEFQSILRGNFKTKIDDKGRIKIPTAFKRTIVEEYGSELYITSLTGENVRIYPFPVWMDLEKKLLKLPSMHPTKMKFLDRSNYFGQMGTMDDQGRVLIPQVLRERARMDGEVAVLGQLKYLEVWNDELFQEKRLAAPFTDDDLRLLSELGL